MTATRNQVLAITEAEPSQHKNKEAGHETRTRQRWCLDSLGETLVKCRDLVDIGVFTLPLMLSENAHATLGR